MGVGWGEVGWGNGVNQQETKGQRTKTAVK